MVWDKLEFGMIQPQQSSSTVRIFFKVLQTFQLPEKRFGIFLNFLKLFFDGLAAAFKDTGEHAEKNKTGKISLFVLGALLYSLLP